MPSASVESTKIVVLNESHTVENFDCGEPARNSWLVTRAFANQRSDDTRTYVALHEAEVVGYYALTVSSILRGVLPGELRRNAADPVSCVLLAQLAVASTHQGRGISKELMLHAMGQAARIAELAGCRLFAVHPARNDLVTYYSRYGLVSVATSPPMMAMSLQKVRKLLAAVGPSKVKA